MFLLLVIGSVTGSIPGMKISLQKWVEPTMNPGVEGWPASGPRRLMRLFGQNGGTPEVQEGLHISLQQTVHSVRALRQREEDDAIIQSWNQSVQVDRHSERLGHPARAAMVYVGEESGSSVADFASLNSFSCVPVSFDICGV